MFLLNHLWTVLVEATLLNLLPPSGISQLQSSLNSGSKTLINNFAKNITTKVTPQITYLLTYSDDAVV